LRERGGKKGGLVTEFLKFNEQVHVLEVKIVSEENTIDIKISIYRL
jgi:hypothetical protein